MDKLAELSHGAKVVLGSALLLLLFSFFNWFEVDTALGDAGENMWHGIGVLAGLLLIALIAWQAIRLVNINLEIGVTPAMITVFLAILTFVFVLIRFIDKPGSGEFSDVIDRTIWAWLGLALAIIAVAGAWWNMRLAGEGLEDLRAKFGGSSGGDSTSGPSSTSSETPPAPPPSRDDTPSP
jgi:hypothetical protein